VSKHKSSTDCALKPSRP